MSNKNLTEQVLDMIAKSKSKQRASKTQLLFMTCGDEILQALDKGLPKKWIWETLREKGYCPPAYTRFLTQLQRFLEKRSQKPTPEKNITNAPTKPAVPAAKTPPTPASAPKTAAPTASAVKQVPAKRLESRSFEYEAPTPEAIKELYGEK